MKDDDFLICGDEQDFAIVPFSKITYQLQDEADEQFAAIIAVLPDTPPNCIVVKIDSSKCLEVLQFLSHKSGVIIIIIIFIIIIIIITHLYECRKESRGAQLAFSVG